jgi:hypothetical protein
MSPASMSMRPKRLVLIRMMMALHCLEETAPAFPPVVRALARTSTIGRWGGRGEEKRFGESGRVGQTLPDRQRGPIAGFGPAG